jgi:magnesium transporter
MEEIKNDNKTNKEPDPELFSNGDFDYSKEVQISLFNYNESFVEEKFFDNSEKFLKHKAKKGCLWINIDNIHNKKIIDSIGKKFNLHSLVIEDIAETKQRPKFEDFDDYSYIVFKMIYFKEDKIITEKVSMIIFKNILITFQEVPGDIFDGIRNSIRNAKGRIRKAGVDFLAYSLINAAVDNYHIILEKIDDQIDEIEYNIMETTNKNVLKKIHTIRNNTIYLRKSIWPLREVIYQLEHGQSSFIKDETSPYFRNINHNIIQIIDQIEIYRESLASMIDIFLTNMDTKLNSVMKRLTIITTIFMPLTVISGIGGMSEWSMITGPENWKISYPLFILGMLAIGIGTYLFLKFKKWL